MDRSLSIVVPTCGRQQSIIALLDDLAAKGVLGSSSTEVVVADNNRERDSLLRQEVESRGCQYVYQARPGQAAALNAGIEHARGDIIVFLDDDVRIISSKWLEDLVSHFSDPVVGYVAGNVLAADLSTPAQRAWEAKGGLSKGSITRKFGREFFQQQRLGGLPLRLIACGANSAARKDVLVKVGLYDERFGVGSVVGHSQSHEICYKILRAGYELVYDSQAVVNHEHPKTWRELHRKMFNYGVGDTAIQLHFFLTYGDYSGLREALLFRHVYLFGNIVKRLQGRYSMPISTVLSGMIGALVGPIIYIARARNTRNPTPCVPRATIGR